MLENNGMGKLLSNLKDSKLPNDNKKFKILFKWLDIHAKYLNFEERFKPNKLIKYNRGDVIKVNFGFNVGNELGGVHYAIVLDNNNWQSSGTLTVVPLSSKKSKDKNSIYIVDLGDMLNIVLTIKMENLRGSIEDKSLKLGKESKEMESLFNTLKGKVEKIEEEKLKLNVIKDPLNHGYFLSDEQCCIIKPKDKSGLGSLPNGIYDEIYRENEIFYHKQAIGKLLIKGDEDWNFWKDNDENIAFKIENFAAITGLNEITTMCSYFKSVTFNEINELHLGIFQGGEKGDIYLCVKRGNLEELTVSGFKKYLEKISRDIDIELYYELKNPLLYRLPVFTKEELGNPNNVEKQSILIESLYYEALKTNDELKNNLDLSEKKHDDLKENIEHEKKVKKELDIIKIGSKALVSQITTISKLRIIDPKHINGALYGVKVDEENLDKIDKQIEFLFFRKLDKS